MIEIKNLYKNYGALEAVKNISLNIPKGQILGLLGPNGAGKSTTLRILTGFLEANSGEVSIDGFSIREQGLETRKLIGYLPESTPLYENMLVYDYLNFIAQARDIPKDKCSEKIIRAAQQCDILEFGHRPIGELSKGQRQRVGLAMAILDDPQVLILDEPTSGLDPNQIIGIRNIIRELGREKTIIFSTHILSEAEAICDRVVIINKGEIVADGSLEELKKHGQSSLILRLEGSDSTHIQQALAAAFQGDLLGEGAAIQCQSSNGSETLVTIQGSKSNSETAKQKIKEVIKANDWFMLGMESKSYSLEDIFHELTQ